MFLGDKPEFETRADWHGRIERTNPARELAQVLCGVIPNNSTFGMYNLKETEEPGKKITTAIFGSTYTKNRVMVVLEEIEDAPTPQRESKV